MRKVATPYMAILLIKLSCIVCAVLGFGGVGAAHAQMIQPGHTALWHSPQRSGEGWVLEVLSDDQALMYWFTFDETAEQRWLMDVGQIEGNRIIFSQMHTTRGGRLGETDPDAVERPVVGQAVMVFESCDNGFFEYDAFGQSQTLEIKRLTVTSSLEHCNQSDTPVDWRSGLTGTWYDPGRSGEGFILQWLARREAMLIWFTYDDTGNQQWIIGTGQLRDEDIVFSDLHTARGTRFGVDFAADEVEREYWGELRLAVNCQTGIVRWRSVHSEFGGGMMNVQPLTRPDALDCNFEPTIWSSGGPYGGNVEFVATSLDNPARIYAGGQQGIFRSDDGGRSWRDIAAGLPNRIVRALAVSPHNADEVVVAVNGRLFKSENAGSKWRPLNFRTEPVYGFTMAVEFNPEDPGTITAGAFGPGIYRSYDGGNSWSRLDTGGYPDAYQFATLPGNPNVMLAAVESGFIRSTDGGHKWTFVDQPVFNLFDGPDNFSGTADGRFVFTYKNSIYWSDNEGSSWRKHQFEDCEVQENDSFWINNLMVVHPEDPNTWFFGGQGRLFKTTDGGATCSRIDARGNISENALFWPYVLTFKPDDPNILMAGTARRGFFHSSDGGESWQHRNKGIQQERIRTVEINPVHGSVVYAGTDVTHSLPNARFWISSDRGDSWEETSDGLSLRGLRAIAVDPRTAASLETAHIYAAGYGRLPGELDLGAIERNPVVFKSTDGGNSWSESAEGIAWTEPDESSFGEWHSRPLMRSLVLDPSSRLEGDGPLQTLYMAGDGYAIREEGDFVVKAHRIYKSTDAGEHWFPADDGLPTFSSGSINAHVHALQVSSLTMDPTRPETLYAGTFLEIDSEAPMPISFDSIVENGVFKSTDGGAHWVHSSQGLPRHDENDVDSSHWDVLALVIAPFDPDVLYIAVSPLYDRAVAHQVEPVRRQGSRIFKTIDAGASWVEMNDGIPPDADIRGLAVDPDDADVVYASNFRADESSARVFRTIDGGASWAVYDTGVTARYASDVVIGKRDDGEPVSFVATSGGVFRR